jgi:hypothetical protein
MEMAKASEMEMAKASEMEMAKASEMEMDLDWGLDQGQNSRRSTAHLQLLPQSRLLLL